MTDRAELQAYRDRFNLLIAEQAEARVQAGCAESFAVLTGACAAFGLPTPALRAADIWEDMEHGQLPPHIVAELTIGSLVHHFPVAVGAFHDTTKDDQIFELCMLRAEANMELDGSGSDGHALDRMRGTLEQMQDWRNAVFE
jgi:hypothetical protein